MLRIKYSRDLQPNARDLGLEVSSGELWVPESLKNSLEALGVRTADALIAALQSFPSTIAASAGLEVGSISNTVAGVYEKLRPYVDARLLYQPDAVSRRRVNGALPPDWLRDR